MCFKVLYKCHRKKLKKKILCRVSELALDKETSLSSARPDTRQRQHVCRVLTASTRQRMTEGPPASPEVFCRVPDTRQRGRLPSVPLYRVFDTRQRQPLPSACFAECPCFDTRQSAEHSAKSASPVVKPSLDLIFHNQQFNTSVN